MIVMEGVNARRLEASALPFPPRLVIPLSQHAGAPSQLLVHPGQEVVRGEPIAKAAGFVSVPQHAPATGVAVAEMVAAGRTRLHMRNSVIRPLKARAPLSDSPMKSGLFLLSPSGRFGFVVDTSGV